MQGGHLDASGAVASSDLWLAPGGRAETHFVLTHRLEFEGLGATKGSHRAIVVALGWVEWRLGRPTVVFVDAPIPALCLVAVMLDSVAEFINIYWLLQTLRGAETESVAQHLRAAR